MPPKGKKGGLHSGVADEVGKLAAEAAKGRPSEKVAVADSQGNDKGGAGKKGDDKGGAGKKGQGGAGDVGDSKVKTKSAAGKKGKVEAGGGGGADAPAEASTDVFVAGLHKDASVADLEEAFGDGGPVKLAKILKGGRGMLSFVLAADASRCAAEMQV